MQGPKRKSNIGNTQESKKPKLDDALSFTNLSEELQTYILNFLSASELASAQLVCRSWYNTIKTMSAQILSAAITSVIDYAEHKAKCSWLKKAGRNFLRLFLNFDFEYQRWYTSEIDSDENLRIKYLEDLHKKFSVSEFHDQYDQAYFVKILWNLNIYALELITDMVNSGNINLLQSAIEKNCFGCLSSSELIALASLENLAAHPKVEAALARRIQEEFHDVCCGAVGSPDGIAESLAAYRLLFKYKLLNAENLERLQDIVALDPPEDPFAQELGQLIKAYCIEQYPNAWFRIIFSEHDAAKDHFSGAKPS